MAEILISFKFDGPDQSIKNHRIDARLLATSLENFANLLDAADSAIYKRVGESNVKVKANFIEGSFGVELIICADPEVLKAIGLVAAGTLGSAFSLLRSLAGRTIDEIEIDESTELAKIVARDGAAFRTTKNVATLVNSGSFRSSLDKLVYQPLQTYEEVDKFEIFEGSIASDIDQPVKMFEATDDTSDSYRKKGILKVTASEESESVAVIEFVTANKETGNSGWRVNYLNKENVAMKIKDEIFLEQIKKTKGTPAIFATKFKVRLKTIKKHVEGVDEKHTYIILKVLGPKT